MCDIILKKNPFINKIIKRNIITLLTKQIYERSFTYLKLLYY